MIWFKFIFWRMSMMKLLSIIFLALFAGSLYAQTGEFSYQGNLNISGQPANGTYDFEFRLFPAESGGTQVGLTATRTGVTVTNGNFNVILSFPILAPGGAFPGADRWLDISVRQSGGGAFQALQPRAKITSAPYAITAANAANASNTTNLGGVAASQYVLTADPRMTDARPPTAGSTSYIQNSTAQQASSNFNISGNGVAGGSLRGQSVSAVDGFDIDTIRVLSIPGTNNTFLGAFTSSPTSTGTDNTHVGRSAGRLNTSGSNNSYFGSLAGSVNTTGSFNAFFGKSAGSSNTAGLSNSFFGALAGESNTSGVKNSFFGRGAGSAVTTNDNNSFFGAYSGTVNTADNNSFFGSESGMANTSGHSNAFFGSGAGKVNTIGHSNSFFGMNAGVATTSGQLNSFFGINSGQSNTTGTGNSFFGANSGTATTVGSNNSFFGRSAGAANSSGARNSFFGFNAGGLNSTGSDNTFFGSNAGDSNLTGASNTFFGSNAGEANSTGGLNSFFGMRAGDSNTGGGNNTFLGQRAGAGNTDGGSNTFVGSQAGLINTTGANNTTLGAGATLSTSALNYATAIGAGAVAFDNETVVLGTSNDWVFVPGGGIASPYFVPPFEQQSTAACLFRYTAQWGIIAPCTGIPAVTSSAENMVRENGTVNGQGRTDTSSRSRVAAVRGISSSGSETADAALDKIADRFNKQLKQQQEQIEAQRSEIAVLRAYICSRDKNAHFCYQK